MKRQRGFTGLEIIIALVVIAAVGAAATTAIHTYNTAITRAETAETNEKIERQAHQDQLVENAGLKVRQELMDKQAAERKSTDERIAALERKVTNALNKLYTKDPESQKWAAAPIPAGVLAVMRDRAAGGASGGQDGARPAPIPVVKPDAIPAVRGGDKRGVTGLVAPAGVRPK